jgi:dipeptidyl aminopeptidase/acylaminoacyl peptidase
VHVEDVRFAGADGKQLSALLYTPDGVDGAHKAPGILAVHGYINSRDAERFRHRIRAARLRRAGAGSVRPRSQPPAFANGFGGPDALTYLRALDSVDPDNIGLEGHSMGGWAVLAAAASQPDGYKSMVLEGSAPGGFGAPAGR